MNGFLIRRWMRFTNPAGRPRLWNPAQWRWNERILVMGESIALISAAFAMASELLQWQGTNWFLLWYA